MKLHPICASLAAVLLAALTLLIASRAAAPVYAENSRIERLHMMQTLLPDSESFVPLETPADSDCVQAVYQSKGGYVVETAADAYAGEIRMLVGVDKNGRVTGLVARDLRETIGLGRRALHDRAFLAQFLNTRGDAIVGKNIDAISGATVTSKAVARSVNAASAAITGVDAASGATWGG